MSIIKLCWRLPLPSVMSSFMTIKAINLHSRCGKPCKIYMEEMRMSKEKKEKALEESLMIKMEEGENYAQYSSRMKEVVSAIRSLGGQL